MGEGFQLLVDAARKLDVDERLKLAEAIMASVQTDSTPEHDAAWLAEAHDRFEAWKRGELPTVSAGQALARYLKP